VSAAAARPRSLRRTVHGLGLLALFGYAAMTLTSYVQAAALWRTVSAPRAQAFFDGAAEELRQVWPWAAQQLAPERWPADNVAVLAGCSLQLALPTLAYMALLMLLGARRDSADEATFSAIRRWAVGFAVAALPAYPVFTQDFWLSVVWGRMIAAGDNPFHRSFNVADLAGLPLDHFPMTMSYGPLWGLVSGAVMLVAGERVFVAGLLFKLVLLGAWLGCLAAAARINREEAPGQRCLTLATLGWAPVGVGQSLAEGHNDVAMVAFFMLWLALATRRRWEASLALMASVLCKYASAPLFLVECVYLFRRERGEWRRVAGIAVPGLAGLGVMALFYRSPEFFDGLRLINDWHFFRPRDAIDGLGRITGVPLGALAVAVTLIFPLVAVRELLVSLAKPCDENLVKLAVAVMATVLFSVIGHVWPWYLIWGLALAALRPAWWLSRFITGAAIVAPFTLAAWWIHPLSEWRDVVSLGLYAFATLWAALPTLGAWRSYGSEPFMPTTVESGRHV
jgi:alpha-1,6-mannosyltransferase